MNPISALASSLRFGGQVPKRKVRGFSICSRTNCGKSAFSFRFGSESFKTNSEIQLPLFDLETEVPKRIVKSWVWLMTIRFGLATTTEWRKSTRTVRPWPDRFRRLCLSVAGCWPEPCFSRLISATLAAFCHVNRHV